MALEGQRTLWEKFSKPLIKKMDNVDPVVLTWLTLPTGLTAAYLLWKADASSTGGLMLLGASILMLISMTLDGLDGTLARAKDATTRWGDFLDHTLDRVLDVTWIVAIGYNVTWFTVDDVNAPELAWAAAMLMMFGSYMGTQAQAVSGSRNYRGFSRADRLVLTWLAVANTMLMAFMGWTNPAEWFGLGINPLSLLVLVCGIGGLYTFIVRFKDAYDELSELDEKEPLSTMTVRDNDDEE